jgi:hypothetical protein
MMRPTNPLRDLMGSWIVQRIAIGVECHCGDVVEVEIVRAKRIENLPHPTTTIALARQALRKHAESTGLKACLGTGEPFSFVYRNAAPAKGTPA